MSQFSSLNPELCESTVRGVIFDMDGTLTHPHAIDFAAMYSRNNLIRSPDKDILTLIRELPTLEAQQKAMRIIVEEEMKGCSKMIVRDNAVLLLQMLHIRKVPLALSTRNCDIAMDFFLQRTNVTGLFNPALHRDSLNGINKPDPEVARFIMRAWSIPEGSESQVWFVGDSLDDMSCGRLAGCRTCLIRNPGNGVLTKQHPDLLDLIVDSLDEFAEHLKIELDPVQKSNWQRNM